MTESRLQRSEIGLDGREPVVGYRVLITPSLDRGRVEYILEQGRHDVVEEFLPEDAYYIGNALMEHALECGYDPDTDETRVVQS